MHAFLSCRNNSERVDLLQRHAGLKSAGDRREKVKKKKNPGGRSRFFLSLLQGVKLVILGKASTS